MADDMFSGLERLGLGGLKDIGIYDQEKKEQEEKKEAVEKHEASELDYLFDKTYKCPVCDNDFKAKSVKSSKAKLLSIELDLRPKYVGIDVLKYDAILCDRCGYSALSRYFDGVTDSQVKNIKEGISKNYLPTGYKGETITYEEAITRHQLALANAVVKKSKTSEKAYICLKISWVIKGYIEELSADEAANRAKIDELKKNLVMYQKNAYEGFKQAMEAESGNICGMDDNTLSYLTAYLALQSGDKSACMKLLSEVIVARDAKPTLKDRARELRKYIK